MATATYYFDGNLEKTATAGSWSDLNDGFDGDIATNTSINVSSTSKIEARGTNSGASLGGISQVKARIYARSGSDFTGITAQIKIANSSGESLGNPQQGAFNNLGWGDYVTLNTPTGDWDWTKLNQLFVEIFNFGNDNGTARLAKIELEVTYSSFNPAFAHRRLLL